MFKLIVLCDNIFDESPPQFFLESMKMNKYGTE